MRWDTDAPAHVQGFVFTLPLWARGVYVTSERERHERAIAKAQKVRRLRFRDSIDRQKRRRGDFVKLSIDRGEDAAIS